MTGLLFRVDLLAISKNIQRAGRTQPNSRRNPQLALDALFQAHGLRFDVMSEKATLDFNGHNGHVMILAMYRSNAVRSGRCVQLHPPQVPDASKIRPGDAAL